MRRPSARSQTGAGPGRQRRTPRPNPSQRAAETGRGPLRWVLGEGSALPMAGQDPALSTSHPFYDVARHGILQVAGKSDQGPVGWDRLSDRLASLGLCPETRRPAGPRLTRGLELLPPAALNCTSPAAASRGHSVLPCSPLWAAAGPDPVLHDTPAWPVAQALSPWSVPQGLDRSCYEVARGDRGGGEWPPLLVSTDQQGSELRHLTRADGWEQAQVAAGGSRARQGGLEPAQFRPLARPLARAPPGDSGDLCVNGDSSPAHRAIGSISEQTYLKFTLDQYVENDYSLVYFHHGLHGGNKPSLGWLQSAYKEFDRKYKKNLKALYVVHPTSFIKVLWKLFKPLISHKFGKKVTYCSSLRELREHLQCDQLPIPQEVLRYDEKLRDLHRGLPPPDTKKPPPRPPLPTQQFGVSLQYGASSGKPFCPGVLAASRASLFQPHPSPYPCSGRGRRGCSSHSSGEVGSPTGWPHQSAGQWGLLKPAHEQAKLGAAPRQRPGFGSQNRTHEKNSVGCVFRDQGVTLGDSESRPTLHLERESTRLPSAGAPPLVSGQVSRESLYNKMNSSSLACVFGLNLIWPSQGLSSLSALVPLNLFTELLIEYHEKVFNPPEAPGERAPGPTEASGQGSPLSRQCARVGAPQDSPCLSRLRVP
ncbi:rho GTPase-activating protein 8 [Marmota marmota marmota]|uniref:rho GTPase-activating protein 8 n=1 Tax=Marmota marmota marmota TaxID=9994 RepID=UPI002092D8B5|nr:rho GTPase-activating protein 8 [Marmota marmota marmota]